MDTTVLWPFLIYQLNMKYINLLKLENLTTIIICLHLTLNLYLLSMIGIIPLYSDMKRAYDTYYFRICVK